MKTIKLSNSDQVALVSDEDYVQLVQYCWYITPKGYAVRIVHKNSSTQTLRMHRVILQLTNPKIQCDHKDRNRLNNQRDNLRIANGTQNHANRKILANKTNTTTSLFKSVSWVAKRNCWLAQIGYNNHCIYLGYFKDEIEAAKAYNAKAIELFGEYVNVNELENNV
jgi:hypothetical protein